MDNRIQQKEQLAASGVYSDRFMLNRTLASTDVLYLNAKVPGELTNTIFETVDRDEINRIKKELEAEFPEAILWVNTKPTSNWKRNII